MVRSNNPNIIPRNVINMTSFGTAANNFNFPSENQNNALVLTLQASCQTKLNHMAPKIHRIQKELTFGHVGFWEDEEKIWVPREKPEETTSNKLILQKPWHSGSKIWDWHGWWGSWLCVYPRPPLLLYFDPKWWHFGRHS